MGKRQKLRCQHDNTWFDRSICAEPCGDMHTLCKDCGYIFGGCYWLNRDAEPAELSEVVLATGSGFGNKYEYNLAGIQKGSMKLMGFYRPHETKESEHVSVCVDGQELESLIEDESRKALADWEKELIAAISLESRAIPTTKNLREDMYGDIRACDCGVRDDSPCCCPLAHVENDYVMPSYITYNGSEYSHSEQPDLLSPEQRHLVNQLQGKEDTTTRANTTHADIADLIDQTLGDIHDLNDSKGREYASEADGLANFKNRAEQMGITPLQVWGIFYGKHSDAIFSYLKRGEVLSEPIEGRIDDAILYLVLLKALVREAS